VNKEQRVELNINLRNAIAAERAISVFDVFLMNEAEQLESTPRLFGTKSIKKAAKGRKSKVREEIY
jgi:hypothetical protein